MQIIYWCYVLITFFSYKTHTQISGSYFNSHVIEIIANVISGTLKKIIGNEIEREKEAETLEGGSGTLLTDETIKVIL